MVFRKDRKFRFKIEAYEERMIRDKLVGGADIEESVDNDVRTINANLTDGDGSCTGSVQLFFQSYDDPMYL